MERNSNGAELAADRLQAGSEAHSSRSPLSRCRHVARSLLVASVWLYQHTIGLALPNSCRFTPTCSDYFIQAVRKHGAIKGAWLGVRRILRCHPYCKGGHDPVP